MIAQEQIFLEANRIMWNVLKMIQSRDIFHYKFNKKFIKEVTESEDIAAF